MNKILSITLSMILLTSMIPAFADDDVTVKKMKWKTIQERNYVTLYLENIPVDAKYIKGKVFIDGYQKTKFFFTHNYGSFKVDDSWHDKDWKITITDKYNTFELETVTRYSDFDHFPPIIKATMPNGQTSNNIDYSSEECKDGSGPCNPRTGNLYVFNVYNFAFEENMLEKENISCIDQFDGINYDDSWIWEITQKTSKFTEIIGYCTDASSHKASIGFIFFNQ